jgi:hypothetical protein
MMTAKATIVLVLAYILALAAGTTSGLLADRLRAPLPQGSKAPLAAQLDLTPAQVEEMRGIWENVSGNLDGYYHRAQDIQRQRDQALVDILTDDQKTKFAIMDKEYVKRYDALKDERDAAFRQALTKTEAMLSDTQRARYEQIVRERIGSFPFQQGAAATEPSMDGLRP